MPVTALALTGNMWVFVVAQVRGGQNVKGRRDRSKGLRVRLRLSLVGICARAAPETKACLVFDGRCLCVVQGLSGLFASTFTITFAYIADIVAKVIWKYKHDLILWRSS